MYIVQNNRLNCAEQRVRFWPPGEDLNFRRLGGTVQDLHRVEGAGHRAQQIAGEGRLKLYHGEKNSLSQA